MKNFKKGFTLIELLVVVAIIGILASVVLASLTSARSKGRDAAIFAQLSNMRAQAELYYTSNNNYGGSYIATAITTSLNIMPPTCTTNIATNSVSGNMWFSTATNGIFGLLKGACASGAQTLTGGVDATTATKWAVSATGASTATFYCVDSSGAAVTRGTIYSVIGGVCA